MDHEAERGGMGGGGIKLKGGEHAIKRLGVGAPRKMEPPFSCSNERSSTATKLEMRCRPLSSCQFLIQAPISQGRIHSPCVASPASGVVPMQSMPAAASCAYRCSRKSSKNRQFEEMQTFAPVSFVMRTSCCILSGSIRASWLQQRTPSTSRKTTRSGGTGIGTPGWRLAREAVGIAPAASGNWWFAPDWSDKVGLHPSPLLLGLQGGGIGSCAFRRSVTAD